ncbi:hypothetical protein ACIBH1_00150 [Nonomuraea sp. NPDC050663]|uniref:hypothetical protein n=1 Tax=Nonomuraea sp. NPDC050663 TaxID=3364370 RepID=UPI00378D2F30
MQRLALFDLDNTLIDLEAAFLRWAEEFVSGHGLGPDATSKIVRSQPAPSGHPNHPLEMIMKLRSLNENFLYGFKAARPWRSAHVGAVAGRAAALRPVAASAAHAPTIWLEQLRPEATRRAASQGTSTVPALPQLVVRSEWRVLTPRRHLGGPHH